MSGRFIVAVSGEQAVGPNVEKSEFVLPCVYEYSENEVRIVYEEHAKGTKSVSTLHYKGASETLSLVKDGETPSVLVLDPSHRQICQIGTEFGSITLGTTVSWVRGNFSEKGGTLSALYSLDVDSKFLSANFLNILVKFVE